MIGGIVGGAVMRASARRGSFSGVILAVVSSALSLIVALASSRAWAETVTIGVPDFKRDLNFFTSESPAAVVVRRAVTAPLVDRSGPDGRTGSLGTGSLGTGSLGTGSLGTGSLGTGALGTGALGTSSGEPETLKSSTVSRSTEISAPSSSASSSPASLAVPSAVPRKSPPFRLVVADSISVSADQLKWSFRIRTDSFFQNRAPMRRSDVLFSLNRCISNRLLPDVAKVAGDDERDLVPGEQRWVKIEVSSRDAVTAGRFPGQLADCPILEERSSEIFADQLGIGTNVVAAGTFTIASLDPGREIRLSQAGLRESGSADLVVRGFVEPQHALTALRTGTIDALFTRDEGVLAKASNDETLLIESCLDYKLVLRRGLQVPCQPDLDMSNVRYVS